jgi:hypothetical protein
MSDSNTTLYAMRVSIRTSKRYGYMTDSVLSSLPLFYVIQRGKITWTRTFGIHTPPWPNWRSSYIFCFGGRDSHLKSRGGQLRMSLLSSLAVQSNYSAILPAQRACSLWIRIVPPQVVVLMSQAREQSQTSTFADYSVYIL